MYIFRYVYTDLTSLLFPCDQVQDFIGRFTSKPSYDHTLLFMNTFNVATSTTINARLLVRAQPGADEHLPNILTLRLIDNDTGKEVCVACILIFA